MIEAGWTPMIRGDGRWTLRLTLGVTDRLRRGPHKGEERTFASANVAWKYLARKEKETNR